MLDVADHRSLGPKLSLFHLQAEAPGSVFWHPRGLLLYRLIEDQLRRRWRADGYLEVRSPQVLEQEIWRQSGHWEHFREDMLQVGERAALKPVSCPGHLQLFKQAAPSWRDLPMRLAELGVCHRNEASGALHGLLRLRQFCQDDGHIFCAEAEALEELVVFCRGVHGFYAAFGFEEVAVSLSGRPPVHGGDDASWRRAEALLEAAAAQAGLAAQAQPGQGAFYGPKLEFALPDRSGRLWQCGTIQLDSVLPGRFDAAFIAPSGEKVRPVILHRALLGSIERFIALLLERHGAQLPAWLAPEQVRIAQLGQSASAWAGQVEAQLRLQGLRVHRDDRAESLGRKVAEAHALGVPFVLAIGQREAEASSVALRDRSGRLQALGLEGAIARLVQACLPPEV